MESPVDTTVVFVAYGMGSLPLGWIPCEAQVIVVHNDDQLDEAACVHPSVEHLHPGANIGFGRAVNLAVEQVETRRIIVCNPDVALGPEHWTALASGSVDEVITVQLVDHEGGPMSSVLPYPSPVTLLAGTFDLISLAPTGSRRRRLLSAVLGSWGEQRRWSVATPPGSYPMCDHWVSGAVFSIDTDRFRKVGGFDPRYFLYLEDTDLCRRVARTFAEAEAVVAPAPPGVHELGGSAHTESAARLVRRSQWDSAVYYAGSEGGWDWWCAKEILGLGRLGHRVRCVASPGVTGN